MTRGRLALVPLAVLLAVGGAACGGGNTDESAGGTDQMTGRQVFVANCGECHTLADAGTTGSVGPVLDAIDPSFDQVERQVRNGGGAMPSFEGRLSDEQIESVSRYVADNAG